MKELVLYGGKRVTIVDDEDYDRLLQFSWIWVINPFSVRRKDKNNNVIPITNEIMEKFNCIFDHKDLNPFNNQKSNLREATKQQNNCNKFKRYNTTSKYKGVSWCNRANSWRAYTQYSGKQYHLGYFKSEINAAKAYDKKAKELQGEFVRLNFPE